MNIIQFLRLISRNILLLIIIPVIISMTVFFLTSKEKKTYSSSTVIYTGIASGYNIESTGSSSKLDFFGLNNAFDNLLNIIKSRETLEKVGISLLAQHLILNKDTFIYISEESYKELHTIVTPDVKALVEKNSFDKTYYNLYNYCFKNESNFIYTLLNSKNPHYSLAALANISAKRIQSSDLVQIDYECDDPGICLQTIVFISKYFTENYKNLKAVQTDDVVRYFEEQVNRTSNNLKVSEDELLEFNKSNKIINYYEQTKEIAGKKENLDVDIQKIQMDYAAAKSALAELDRKLTDKDKIYLKSEEILRKSNKLSTINSRISLTEIYNENNSVKDYDALKNLKNESETLKKQLNDDVDQLYLYGRSREGLPIKELLSQWLTNSIKKEETKASLDVLLKRKSEFGSIYSLFAPMGATLKRIERKIGITESEYLELLHSLTLAKLKQQNVELSSSLKIVDQPFLPLVPKASKRKMLIIIAGLVGFVIVLFSLILVEYFDSTIKTPERLENLTKIKLAGIYPLFFKNKKNNSIDLDFVTNRSIEMISQNLKLKINNVDSILTKPNLVVFFSTRNKEGKSSIIDEITNKFREYGDIVLCLKYFHKNNSIDKTQNHSNHNDNYTYNVDSNFFEIKNITELLNKNYIPQQDEIKYIFIEIPSILSISYPSDIIRETNLSILICRANRSWSKADTNVLNVYKEVSNNKILSILNGVELYHMESILGEIPMKRSKIRRILKKIIKLQFHERNNLE